MNYKLLYDKIILSRKENSPIGYIEKHHIIPQCLGGTDEESNIVALSAREHFICHYLLTKIYDSPKLVFAFRMMKMDSLQSRYFNSRLYKSSREKFASSISEILSESQSGSGNSQYGTMWICDVEHKINRKIKRQDPIPIGWQRGKWKSKIPYSKICPNCSSTFDTKSAKRVYCCDGCKEQHKMPRFKIVIDENLEEMISIFDRNKSITKTLSLFGLNPDTREGNSYFSKILKSRDRNVKRCRNTGMV